MPGFGAYWASKAGNEALTRSLALEVAHLGVDVGVAYFGWIDTDLVRGASERESFRLMRSRLRGPLGQTFPVSATGKAIVRGIEHRSKYVVVPPAVRAMSYLRGVLQPLVEKMSKRDIAESMAVYEAEIQRDPSVLGPVGAGGEADARASGVGAPSA
jgi:NAD(P)-dependent dehydrogenase (short-subunit alcohol dehydrogenase family)